LSLLLSVLKVSGLLHELVITNVKSVAPNRIVNPTVLIKVAKYSALVLVNVCIHIINVVVGVTTYLLLVLAELIFENSRHKWLVTQITDLLAVAKAIIRIDILRILHARIGMLAFFLRGKFRVC
jgi:hypothetical protein